MHQGLELLTRQSFSPQETFMYRKVSKNKPMSADGKPGEEWRTKSITCAVSRKLFREGLTKELSKKPLEKEVFRAL